MRAPARHRGPSTSSGQARLRLGRDPSFLNLPMPVRLFAALLIWLTTAQISAVPALAAENSLPSISKQERELIDLLNVKDDAQEYAANRRTFAQMEESTVRFFMLSQCNNRGWRGIERLTNPSYLSIVERGLKDFSESNAAAIKELQTSPSSHLGAFHALRELNPTQQTAWLAYLRTEQAQLGVMYWARLQSLAVLLDEWRLDIRTGEPIPQGTAWLSAYLTRAQLRAPLTSALQKNNAALAIKFDRAMEEGLRSVAAKAETESVFEEVGAIFPKIFDDILEGLPSKERGAVRELFRRPEFQKTLKADDQIHAARKVVMERRVAQSNADWFCKNSKDKEAQARCKEEQAIARRPLNAIQRFVTQYDVAVIEFAEKNDMRPFAKRAAEGKCDSLNQATAKPAN
jgi:hypothetical protein